MSRIQPDPTTTIAAAITDGRIARNQGEQLLAHIILVANGVSLRHVMSPRTWARRRHLAKRLGFAASVVGPEPMT